MQVASSDQWVLGVQIQHFVSMHNIVLKDNMYCCCDGGCFEGSANTLNSKDQCDTTCQPYFVLHFEACSSNETYIAKNITFSGEFTSVMIQIPFNQSELKMYNRVRICN